MRRKSYTGMIVAATVLILITAGIALLSIQNASKLLDLHAGVKDRIKMIPPSTWEELNQRYQGYAIFYNVAGQTSLFGIDPSDTLYGKFKIEKWFLEGSASTTGQLKILAPEFGWNPDRSRIEDGGWVLDGWVGSTVTLNNPRLDPDDGGSVRLEVVDRSNEGVVLVFGVPAIDSD